MVTMTASTSPDTASLVPQTLRSAAQILRAQPDLGRRAARDKAGNYCMFGAVEEAASRLRYGRIYTERKALADEANDVLIEILPDHCSQHGGALLFHVTPISRVFHHNDYHCDGGAHAAEILEHAAEKFEARETL